jgi:hypothetical protein
VPNTTEGELINMSVLVPFRAFNRSRKPRIGGKTIGTTTTYVNVDSPRVKRDLSKVSAIGSFVQAGIPFFSADDGVVLTGCVVTPTGVNNQVAISAGRVKNAAGVESAVSAGTVTLVPNAGFPIVSLVVVNADTGAIVAAGVAGAATAGTDRDAALFNHTALPATPADRIALAHVYLPQSNAAVIPAANIIDVRP